MIVELKNINVNNIPACTSHMTLTLVVCSSCVCDLLPLCFPLLSLPQPHSLGEIPVVQDVIQVCVQCQHQVLQQHFRDWDLGLQVPVQQVITDWLTL